MHEQKRNNNDDVEVKQIKMVKCLGAYIDKEDLEEKK